MVRNSQDQRNRPANCRRNYGPARHQLNLSPPNPGGDHARPPRTR